MRHFLLKNGTPVTEYEIKKSFEIFYGFEPNENELNGFINHLNNISIECELPMNDDTVRLLAEKGYTAQATHVYWELHGTSLVDAKKVVDDIRKGA